MAARRALTFLEQQPEVDANRLGVYGHSMGGKLTVMAATDSRVKAAAPSCSGISDRDNKSRLFRATLGDDVSLKKVSCPIVFLSPAQYEVATMLWFDQHLKKTFLFPKTPESARILRKGWQRRDAGKGA